VALATHREPFSQKSAAVIAYDPSIAPSSVETVWQNPISGRSGFLTVSYPKFLSGTVLEHVLRILFLAACGGLLAALSVAPAFAAESFDGAWRVNASTETANPRCKDRTVSLRIEDGDVRYAGLLSGLVSGTIDRDGKLRAQVAKIRVSGTLSGGSGSGA